MNNFEQAAQKVQKDFERKQIDLPNVSDVGIQSSFMYKTKTRHDWKARGVRMTYQELKELV